jgi:hypothetical protein
MHDEGGLGAHCHRNVSNDISNYSEPSTGLRELQIPVYRKIPHIELPSPKRIFPMKGGA